MPVIDINKWKQRYIGLSNRVRDLWEYVSDGVWRDSRNIWWINIIKTLNLSVRSFLDTDLQSRACAMAFRTILAIIPALALLFAIGRGFGLQTLIEQQLYNAIPSQHVAISTAIGFVDSYLNQSGNGIFLGIGIVFLLWTIISLVGNVEKSFNKVWGLKSSRSLWRKITDYTAMLLILPVLMICAGGLTIFMSSWLQNIFAFEFMTPVIHFLFDAASWIFTWLFFAAVFILIPNTKVKRSNALIAGIVAGTGFRILQWIFISGQLYVSRYNAIYGSFAFLPLLMMWLQLTWVVTLSGALLCYASQNIFRFSYHSDINRISTSYKHKVAIGIAAIVTRTYIACRKAPTEHSLSLAYGIPSKLVTEIVNMLVDTGIVARVVIDKKSEVYGLQPAINPKELTVKLLLNELENHGCDDFLDKFNTTFEDVDNITTQIRQQADNVSSNILIEDINIPLLDFEEE